MIFFRNQKINLIVLVKKYKNGRGRGDAAQGELTYIIIQS